MKPLSVICDPISVGWVGSSHTNNKQFLDTSRVSCSQACIRFHRLRVQSYKTAPHTWKASQKPRLLSVLLINWLQIRGANLECQFQVQVVTCTSDQPAVNQRFPQPSPQVPLIC